MDITQIVSLLVLALVDSTSFGTLVIPVFFLLTPGGVRPGRVLLFLGTVAALYWSIGIALLLGVQAVAPDIGEWFATRPGALVLLVVGIVMLAGSFLIPGKKAYLERKAAAEERGEEMAPGRLARWRDRAVSGEGGTRQLMGLAALAVLAELATMLPYMGAITIISSSGLSLPARAATLALYCLVMILPALVLLAIRLGLGNRITAQLSKVAEFLERESAETVAWIVGIAGFLIARSAFTTLGGMEWLQSLGA